MIVLNLVAENLGYESHKRNIYEEKKRNIDIVNAAGSALKSFLCCTGGTGPISRLSLRASMLMHNGGHSITAHAYPSVQRPQVTDNEGVWQPVAVCSSIDVLGLNKRVVLELRTEHFGRVVFIIIGAVQVGSIHLSVWSGQAVHKVLQPTLFLPSCT
jgi:hypothetical protein